jgi:hypothetical protein
MQFKKWLEGHRQNIAQMQPDSIITVFHGTSADDAYNFCLNGIDAKKQQKYRIYPHVSGGKPIKFGIFVAPDLKTAQKFGHVILKFKTLGKDLIYRFPTEMKKYNSGFYKELYPKSFRPVVSYDMLDKGVEPQAIYTGLLSPRAIEKLFVYNYGANQWSEMNREDYIQNYSEKNPQTKIFQSPFEPQNYKMSLEDFVKKLAQEHRLTEKETLAILKDIYRKSGYLTGIGDVPPTLLKRIEKQLSILLRHEGHI